MNSQLRPKTAMSMLAREKNQNPENIGATLCFELEHDNGIISKFFHRIIKLYRASL